MVYIYKLEDGSFDYQYINIPQEPYIELERMIPMPIRSGYKSILKADFDTKQVWYEFELTLEGAKNQMKEKIMEYDSSDAVNDFSIQGLHLWLDLAKRTGLKLRFEAERAQGQEDTTLWHDGMQFPLKIENALMMLFAIEVYASECYDNTQLHIANVEKLETIEEVLAYDYKTGYPEKLEF